MNAVLYYENQDPRQYISMVPTSAMTGEGMGNLMALIIELTQSMMAKRLAFSEELQATVLEVYYFKIYNFFLYLAQGLHWKSRFV